MEDKLIYTKEHLNKICVDFFTDVLEENDITESSDLKLLGIGSVIFSELSVYLDSHYKIKSNPSRFFNLFTINDISSYLLLEPGYTDVPKENTDQPIAEEDDEETTTQIIAITGTAFRVPGADTKESLWELLKEGRSMITSTPSGRWNWPEEIDLINKHKAIDKGAYIDDIDKFDASFFHISPQEAELMDPQQRLLLELTWELLETSGYNAADQKGSKTGVYIGASGSDYELLLRDHSDSKSLTGTGTALSILANRISYFFDFEGPSLQIDTACSSSLVAIHEALRSIRSGESTQAIAGGIHVMCHPARSMAYHQSGMLGKDGRCYTFDERANGYVRAEGAVVMLLKPLEKALADGDMIHGIIRGSAVNHGGQTAGLTVPDFKKQCKLLEEAYTNSKTDITTVSYIEAHGTGTPLGDPIEVIGLSTAFKKLQDRLSDTKNVLPAHWCGIGSVKSNLGHLEAASGITGMLKVLVSMEHKMLPPTINFEKLNAKIDLENSPFYIQNELKEWTAFPLRAGISSFGIGGANAHVILESYETKQEKLKDNKNADHFLFILSAKNGERLKAYVKKIQDYLFKNSALDLREFCYTLQVTRVAMEERLAIVFKDLSELHNALDIYIQNVSSKKIHQGNTRRDKRVIEIFEEERSIVEGWLKNKQLPEIAKYWSCGLAIDWRILYGDDHPRRISLPSYPFARERYWIPEAGKGSVTIGQWLHPLLQYNESTLSEQKFSSNYTGKENFFNDHRVRGEKILPGVAYIEMGRIAAALSSGKTVTEIKETIWLSPVRIKSASQKIYTGIYVKNDELGYEIYSIEGGDVQLHCQGMISTKMLEAEPKLNLLQIQDRLKNSMEKEDCYALLKDKGLEYGKSFQGIEKLYYEDQEVLSRISLPKEEGYVLTPGLLDSAVQSCAVLSRTNASLALPFSVGRVSIYKALPEKLWSYARRSERNKKGTGEKVKSYDIDLFNDEGEVLVSIKEFAFASIDGYKTGKKQEQAATYLYSTAWIEKEIRTSGEAKRKEGEKEKEKERERLILLAGGSAELSDKLRESLECEVQAINGSTEEIYFLEALDRVKEVLLKEGSYELTIVYNNDEYVEHGFVSGLLKTAMQEKQGLLCRAIGVESLSDKNFGELEWILKKEEGSEESEVRYREGKREVRAIIELQNDDSANNSNNNNQEAIRICKGGVYLVTGGAGGLGKIVATAIAKTEDTFVILAGRSELHKEIKNTAYYRCDISRKEEVKGLIKEIRKKYGRLDGIIHSSGVVRDSLIIKKTREEVRQVLSPKIEGVKNLVEAIGEEEETFIVLFSSVSGVTGNIGQGDYSSANAYLDSYAVRHNEKRENKRENKRVRLLSINWPLWKEGGMQVDADMISYLERQGLYALPSEEGVNVLKKILESGEAQTIVMYGKKEAVAASLQGKEIEALKQTNSGINNLNTEERNALQEASIKYIRRILTEELKLPEEKLEADAPFESYGIDSIMVNKLTNRLDEIFGRLPRTLFFEYHTLEDLTKYFINEKAGKLTTLIRNPEKEYIAPQNTTPANFNRVKKTEKHFDKTFSHADERSSADIAIIGLSGKYPGANTINDFWENLRQGKDSITEIPADRWDIKNFYDKQKGKEGKSYGKWGGFIDHIDKFDALFFGISPKEAQLMDPQERLFLQVAWETLEDAGYVRQSAGKGIENKVGVYVGVMYEEYQLFAAEETLKGNPVAIWQNPSSIPNRVSYFCNFHGPSIAIDTMCSSSLTAIHLACESIRNNNCELAIAGGVNISIHPNKYLMLSQGRFLSGKGYCESFGIGGEGYVPGEGVGAVLLKPLSRAEADGDHIYGVIKSTSVNHGGKTNGYTVPNPNAQASVIKEAMRKANVKASDFSYIEAHGTGTSLGDPIEIAGLMQAFQTKQKQYCRIGSVKSNIGHCESAAGISGLTKVLLQLRHKQLVPSLHSKVLNPNIDFANSPFKVQQECEEWTTENNKPRLAGISSFGAGGSNAHIIVEEYTAAHKKPVEQTRPAIIVLSAKNKNRLTEQVKNLLHYLQSDLTAKLHEIEHTLQAGRESMEERLAIVAGNREELVTQLNLYLENKFNNNDESNLFTGNVKDHNNDFLLKGNAGKGYIEIAIRDNESRSLAGLWTRGIYIDWDLLYTHERPVKISLPPYPFSKERYWIPGSKNTPVIANTDINKKDDREPALLQQSIEEEEIKVVIIGAGLFGICMGYYLQQAKIPFTIIEKNEDVGGVWFRNRWPGCGCDIPMLAYAYSFEHFKGDMWARQPDILKYLKEVVRKNELYEHIQLNTTVIKAEYSEEEGKWRLHTNAGKIIKGQYFINGGNEGLGHTKKMPVIKGMEEFKGVLTHSLDCDESKMDFKNKRVAIIGNGTTQVQLVEALQPLVKKLVVYARSPKYIYPKAKYEKATEEKLAHDYNFWLKQRAIYLEGTDNFYDVLNDPIKLNPFHPKANLEKYFNRILDKDWHSFYKWQAEIGMTPEYFPGCSRPCMSHTYHNQIRQSNTRLEVNAIESFTSSGIKTKNSEDEFDIIICATGYDLNEFKPFFPVTGRNALTLQEAFDNFPQTYAGCSVVAFPNLFIGAGANSGTNATSITAMYEITCKNLVRIISYCEANHIKSIEIKKQEVEKFAAFVKKENKEKSFHSGCSSWYQTQKGENAAIFPGSLTSFQQWHEFDPLQYEFEYKTSKQLLRADQSSVQTIKIQKEENNHQPEFETISRQDVQQEIVSLFLTITGLSKEQMIVHDPIGNYGLDSIMISELVEKINAQFFLSLKAVTFYDLQTVDEMVAKVYDEVKVNVPFRPIKNIQEKSIQADHDKMLFNDHESINKPAQEYKSRQNKMEPVAIIGVSGRFPMADNIGEYWRNIESGRDCIVEIPADRWDWKSIYDDPAKGDYTKIKWGGFIDDVDKFDPSFFKLSPLEAELMDPQHRLFLQAVWEAIESAGYCAKELKGKKIGVYYSANTIDYQQIASNSKQVMPAVGMQGQWHVFAPSRISYLLGLHGPCEVIDTACSSSGVAIHHAIQSMMNDNCEAAIVGATNLFLLPDFHKMYDKAGMLSEDGRCKTFSAKADGYSRGEGVGVVLLKKLSLAERDGDPILGVIKAVAINHGGQSVSLTAPNAKAQSELIKTTLRIAGTDPRQIGLIECHGTGTSLGDPIEIEGLTRAYHAIYDELAITKEYNQKHTGLGSVKSNIGHTEPLAALAGLIKILAAIENKRLPATLHTHEINPRIQLENTPFYILQESKYWQAPEIDGKTMPRTASLSTFGVGGTNAHLIIEEYVLVEKSLKKATVLFNKANPAVIVLSAKNKERLKVYVERMLLFLKNRVNSNSNLLSPTFTSALLTDIAYTLQTGREAMEERVAFLAGDIETLIEKLECFINGQSEIENVYIGNVNKKASGKTFLSADEYSEATIIKLMREGQFKSLAQLWVKGVSIDWKLLYGDNSPRRISLPTYPFARDRYWITGKEKEEASKEPGVLHPLLHQNQSDLQEHKYISVYTGEEEFLKDHRVLGEKVLPGVAYLELAREAGWQGAHTLVTRISEIVWLRPLIVKEQPEKVTITIEGSSDALKYEISTKSGQAKQVHGQGVLHIKENITAPGNMDIAAISQRLNQSIQKQQCYELFKSKGLDYGKSFRGIESIHYSETESLAHISLPLQKEYELPPGVLDSALQGCMSLADVKEEDGLPLPFSIKEVIIYKELPAALWSYARHSEGSKAGEKVKSYDIDLLNDQGEILVSIKEFVTLSIKNLAEREKRSGEKAALYIPVWERVKGRKKTLPSAGGEHIIIKGQEEETGRQAEGILKRAGYVVRQLSDLGELSEKEGVSDIYFLQGVTKTEQEAELSIFRDIKWLLDNGYKDRVINITALTLNTQKVLAGDKITVAGAGIAGLLGSLAKENPQWNVRVLDIEASTNEKELEAILKTGFDKTINLHCYRQGNVYQRKLVETALKEKETTSVFKNRGVYVIAGGSGGIGQATTKYLVNQYNAQVIWLGRSEASEHIKTSAEAIGKQGSTPVYIQCDITNHQSVERAHDIIIKKYGEINGLFHSAIVLKDRWLNNMSEEEFTEAFSVKSAGARHLVEVMGESVKDFICFYSSVQSQVNAPGQSNYSAGCTYKDSYGLSLSTKQGKKIAVINWGYWGEVGIVSSDEYREGMELMGMGSINAAEGMEVLERILKSKETQVAVLKLTERGRKAIGIIAEEKKISFAEKRSLLSIQQIKPQPYETDAEQERGLQELCGKGILQELIRMGMKTGQREDELREVLGIEKKYERLLHSIVESLEELGYINKERERIKIKEEVASFDLSKAIHSLIKEEDQYRAHAHFLKLCLDNFKEIVRGRVRATDIIFPEGKLDHVKGIYKGNYQSDYFNDLMSDLIAASVKEGIKKLGQGEKLRILEVGAGTGGSSEVIFEKIKQYSDRIEYIYTDVSKSFLQYGAEHYGEKMPGLQTKLFNIEQWPGMQGLETGSCDMVIGANVVHATRDIAASLANIKGMLKEGGLLVLNELSRSELFGTLTFGLLDGWWLYEDEEIRLKGSPGLSTLNWQRVLTETGYGQTISYPMQTDLAQQIILAKSNGILITTNRNADKNKLTPDHSTKKNTAINEETKSDNNKHLEKRIKSFLSETISSVIKIPPSEIEFATPLAEYGIDSIVGLSLIKEINSRLRISLPTTVLFSYPTINDLSNYLRHQYNNAFEFENLPVLKTGQSLLKNKQAAEIKNATTLSSAVSTAKKLLVNAPGNIDAIEVKQFKPVRPGAGEVLVAIESFALNFGDLLCIKGLYPTLPSYPFTPGFEAAGIIMETGTGVTEFNTGDAVIVLAGKDLGMHASHVTIAKEKVFRKPVNLSLPEACCMPTVALTVIESFRRANPQKGETILIQTATGGVGLLAVQLAQYKELRIIATAGSKTKLKYLRDTGVNDVINYLEQDFETEVKRITSGQGVDVVINTLGGQNIQKGINCLGKRGRYVELSMTAIQSAGNIGLNKFSNNQSFISLDLARLLEDDLEYGRNLWQEYLDLVERKIIKPVISAAFDFNDYDKAYQCLEQRDNIGKVIVNISHHETADNQTREYFSASSSQKDLSETLPDDIAIIGMSGQFGAANNPQEFWNALKEGRSLVEKVPAHRWTGHAINNNTNSRYGSLLQDIDKFDPLFFRISGREAETMDPQQRLFLEHCWKAIEDAALKPDQLAACKCGVYVGAVHGDYMDSFTKEINEASAFWGNAGSILASRISYYLNLKGPAMAIDTACSSSLVAMDMGCKSLQLHENDLVISGGISLFTTSKFYNQCSKAGMLSPDGKCFTFDNRANGFVPGEAVGVVIMKRLKDAIRDEDPVYGVIKGVLTNQDGTTSGITAPSNISQRDLEKEVYTKYKINPETITYVEAHGTGTRLGDPIEFQALTESFRSFTNKKQYCGLGSVKTNIGHTVMAAGVAAVIKVLLSFRHKQLPPTLNYNTLNEHINLEGSPFYINTALTDWEIEEGAVRRAGISSFGFSGTNAHMVLEEYREKRKEVYNSITPALIVLSARNADRLKEQVKNLINHLDKNQEINLYDIAYTLQAGREAMEERLALTATTKEALTQALNDYHSGITGQYYTGNIHKGSIDLLPESEAYIIAAIKNKEIKLLAQLWIQGASIDWRLLYGDNLPRRINLPAYPFARERYWVSETNKSLVGAEALVLHPLLHKNESDIYEHKYVSHYTGDEFFLAQHVIEGKKILPAVAYLELVREAASRSSGKIISQLRDIKWLNPITTSGETLQVFTKLSAHDEELNFEVYSLTQNGKIIHSNGKARTSSPGKIYQHDLSMIRTRCTGYMHGSEFYSEARITGLNLGDAFKGIQELYFNKQESLARIRPLTADGFLLSPGIMDSALQTFIGVDINGNGKITGMPYRLGEIKIHGSLEGVSEFWSYARKRTAFATGLTSHFDIDLSDSNGNVLISFVDLIPIPLNLENHSSKEQERPATYLYSTAWVESEIKTSNEAKRKEGEKEKKRERLILLAGGSAELSDKLRESLECEVQLAGGSTEEIYFLEVLEKVREVLLRKENYELTIMYNNGEYVEHGFVSGLLKTAMQEKQGLLCHTIGVESLSDKSFGELEWILQQEEGSEESEVRYSGGKREAKKIIELNNDDSANNSNNNNQETIAIRKEGVYLITGGAGGLGKIFATAIAKTADTCVVLAGRKELNEEIKKELQTLKHAEYYRCDISNKEEVKRLIKEIRKKYGRLDGIFHSSGVVRDSLIIKKTSDEAREVLSPKIEGVKNLAEAIGEEDETFIVLFSSVSGVTGNIGQGDYSSANAYLDSYAVRYNVRRKNKRVRLLSINWPLWKEGGMQVDADTGSYLERQVGMLPLPTDEGIRCFTEIGSSAASHVIAAYGKKSSIDKKLVTAIKKNTPLTTSPADMQELHEKITGNIIALTAQFLKIDIDVVKSDKEFGVFGFDSILLTRFSNELNDFYGLDLIPTIFYNYSTPGKLAKFLTDNYPEQTLERHKVFVSQIPATIHAENRSSALSRQDVLIDTAPGYAIPAATVSADPDGVAIIGMSGRFPGSPGIESFWKNLRENKDLITEIPADRWDWKKYYGDAQKERGKTKAKWGGFIDDIDKFDPLFFGISPREAELMDPQQRITLEAVYHALEDAGIQIEKIKGSNTGVFIGVCTSDYLSLINNHTDLAAQAQYSTGSAHSMLVNRISYLLDIHGPSEPVDTACSSSLIAIHKGVENIRNGHCNLVIAGGVNALLSPELSLSFSQAGMLSDDGRCKTFDKSANGYVRSEGVGMIILKSLRDAERDGDHIYGVIAGTAQNHGGKANTLTSPNMNAQKDLLEKIYSSAGIEPGKVSYIEAHGTGTSLGDPIETEALRLAFANLSKENFTPAESSYCGIGSVKANIGHLEAAAGIAGIIKVLLSLKHNLLPGNPHLKNTNEYLRLTGSPFYLVKDTMEWKSVNGNPRVAGVSSFGFGGANAHIIIKEYNAKRAEPYTDSTPAIIPLSAKNDDRLRQLAGNLENYLQSATAGSLHEIAYTLQTGREIMEERLVLLVNSKEELIAQLSNYLLNIPSPLLFTGNTKKDKTVFVLKGEAGQAYIQKAIAAKEYESLSQLWISGVSIDWNLFYPQNKPSKISLPGYPFARERYWYDQRTNNNGIVNTAAANQPYEQTGNDVEKILAPVSSNEIKKKEKSYNRDEVARIILQMLADALYIAVEQVDEEEKFVDLGLDSIIGVELIRKINEKFITGIAATDLYNYPSLHSLAAFVYEQLPVIEKDNENSLPAEEKLLVSFRSNIDPVNNEAGRGNKKITEGIAIIGISAKLPGASNADEFWKNLQAGINTVIEIPEERWKQSSYYDPDPDAYDRSYSKWMGAIDDIDKFDPVFFNISPKEAELMDPQQRLILEETWKAIEDAGYKPSVLSAMKCGVFIGASQGDYMIAGNAINHLNAFTLTGNSTAILSGRISYMLNLKGPCVTVDTACSSSLVAIAQACDSLLLGNCDIVLAGGVNVLTSPALHIMTSKASMLSKTGQCRTFDNDADGIVPSEGACMIVLKKVADAVRDGDQVYGIIKGWGVNQDGSTNGIMAPSDLSQTTLQTQVYDRFDIHPETISYVEAHGTGTKLGDPIEIKALQQSFSQFTNKKNYCAVGSVKTNIGHTLSVAGIASVIKVLLSLGHRQIPPSINYRIPNALIDFTSTSFYINTSLKNWNTENDYPRRAGINSFGFSGTNAHIIIEEYIPAEKNEYSIQLPAIILLSARNTTRLQEQVKNLEQFLDKDTHADLYDIAYTLQTGRQAMEERLGILAYTIDDLKEKLKKYLTGISKKDKNHFMQGSGAMKRQHHPGIDEKVDAFIKNEKPDELISLWCAGTELDWSRLYPGNKPQKISLPAYPFEKRRCWFDKNEVVAKTSYHSLFELKKAIPPPANKLLKKSIGDDKTGMPGNFEEEIAFPVQLHPSALHLQSTGGFDTAPVRFEDELEPITLIDTNDTGEKQDRKRSAAEKGLSLVTLLKTKKQLHNSNKLMGHE